MAASPTITSSAASPSPTTSRRSTSISSRASISFPNRAAAEVDAYGGARLTVGQFAFDVGAWGYLYPGGTCQFGAPGVDFAGNFQGTECATNALINGNVLKKDVSFFEVYGKVNYTFNDNFSMGGNVYYTPSFLNSGAEGTYASIVGKAIANGTLDELAASLK